MCHVIFEKRFVSTGQNTFIFDDCIGKQLLHDITKTVSTNKIMFFWKFERVIFSQKKCCYKNRENKSKWIIMRILLWSFDGRMLSLFVQSEFDVWNQNTEISIKKKQQNFLKRPRSSNLALVASPPYSAHTLKYMQFPLFCLLCSRSFTIIEKIFFFNFRNFHINC